MTTEGNFLDAVQPKAAIISVGPNLYGHPAAAALARLQAADCRILRTDRQGAIQIKFSPGRWQISAMQPEPP
jgi:competence protein ComEC